MARHVGFCAFLVIAPVRSRLTDMSRNRLSLRSAAEAPQLVHTLVGTEAQPTMTCGGPMHPGANSAGPRAGSKRKGYPPTDLHLHLS